MQTVAALVAGLIFGLGILVSGMGNPAKVINFFDIAGHWDPSLAFVMGGALLVNVVGYRIALNRSRPVLASTFSLPSRTHVDAQLLVGAAIFGIGWGLSGFCPGGLLPVIGLGYGGPLVFLIGLIAGIAAAQVALRRVSNVVVPAARN